MTHVPFKLILAAALAVSNAPLIANAADPSPHFNLGIVVSSLPTTPAKAQKYVSTLSKGDQRAMVSACDDSIRQPRHNVMAGPIRFCHALLSK
jgi:hypothetical protein